MTGPLRILISAGTALVAGSLLSVTAIADDQDAVDDRERIMKTMGEQVAAILQMQKSQIAPTNVAVHTKSLAITATTAKSAFEPKVAAARPKQRIFFQATG